MPLALSAARIAAEQQEVPVGAVIVDATGHVIAVAHNLTETIHDPSAHAEILALRMACERQGSPRLEGCDLYVTLEPCPMCAAAISYARVRRLYFGAYDVKSGGVENGPRVYSHASCHHAPEVYGGISESECSALLRQFFAEKR